MRPQAPSGVDGCFPDVRIERNRVAGCVTMTRVAGTSLESGSKRQSLLCVKTREGASNSLAPGSAGGTSGDKERRPRRRSPQVVRSTSLWTMDPRVAACTSCSDRLRGRIPYQAASPRPSRGQRCPTRLRASSSRRRSDSLSDEMRASAGGWPPAGGVSRRGRTSSRRHVHGVLPGAHRVPLGTHCCSRRRALRSRWICPPRAVTGPAQTVNWRITP